MRSLSGGRSVKVPALVALGVLAVLAATSLFALHALRTETQAASSGPEMRLTVKSSVGGFSCTPGQCTVASNSSFVLAVEVVEAPANGYILAQTFIRYADGLAPDLVYKKAGSHTDEIVWPDCDPSASLRGQANPGEDVNHACLTSLLPPQPKSNFVGNIVEIELNCTNHLDSHLIELLPKGHPTAGSNGALFTEPDGSTEHIPKVSNLTINCNNFPTCFSGDTPIDTPDGPRRLDELAVGDAVLSYDHTSGTFASATVETVFARTAGSYLVVTLADGTRVRVTAEHPFFDPVAGGYLAIGQFSVGDLVARASQDGLRETAITSIKQVNEPVRVYNLHVGDENHNYVAAGVLVHNKTVTPPPTPPSVGGVTALASEASGSSSIAPGLVAIVGAAAAIALGAAAWYAMRRWAR